MIENTISLYDKHQNSLNNLKRQQHLTMLYGLPLIIVKTNISYEMDENDYDNFVYRIAEQEVKEKLSQLESTIVEYDNAQDKTNLESIFVIKGSSASYLKRAMAHIENNHPLGSLINIDVINSQGVAVSRKGAQMEPRKCLLCHCPASYCATNHRHPVQEIKDKIKYMIEQYSPQQIAI